MKIIRVSTDLEMAEHEFPEGNCNDQNRILRGLIGNNCNIYERVTPERLYTKLHIKRYPTNVPGECVSMLVDNEGISKQLEPNLLGSILYGTDRHGHPILGNILFVGERWGDMGIGFCGIDHRVFETLRIRLSSVIKMIKVTEEVMLR